MCLEELGCVLESLPAEPDFPDSVFVEDVAVVLDEIAVITRPGAVSRRGERASIAQALAKHRFLAHIRAPGILDGGDVLRVAKNIFVGLSGRTDREGIIQLRRFLEPNGYLVTEVEFTGCLHLKSAVTRVAREMLLINPDWVDPVIFDPLRVVTVDPDEPAAANALQIAGSALLPAQYPRTLARLRRAEVDIRSVDVSELIKAEAGVTCCSLVFESRHSPETGA
jgi:dimethylargininase